MLEISDRNLALYISLLQNEIEESGRFEIIRKRIYMRMEKRLDNAQFHIGTPVCFICRNMLRRKYSDANPDAPIMTCSVLGEIPREIDLAISHKCGEFILDSERYEQEEDWLPKGFDLLKIKES